MNELGSFSPQFREYCIFYKKYKKIYGENIVILYQNGGFYELYDYIDGNNNNLCGDIHKISNILTWTVTLKDKSKPYSTHNHYMSGAPIVKHQKYCDILLNNNYTVIVVTQISRPPNIDREVTSILSPGTVLDDYNHKKNDNNLMSIYIERSINNHKEFYSAGISIINVSTGQNMILNIIPSYENDIYTDNEIKRLLSNYNPIEILIHLENFSLTKDEIINKYEINHTNIFINHFEDNTEYKQLNYQNTLLQKVFNFETMGTPIEELNLERRDDVLLSYIYLLNFIYEHKTDLINNIEKPIELNDNKCLLLSSDSIRQLNIFDNYDYYDGRDKDLFSLLCKTVTPMGKRLFKNRLLYPSIDTEIINKRYDKVELLLSEKIYEEIRNNLRRLNDYERSLRKMSLNLLDPYILYSDFISYEFIIQTINLIKNNDRLYDKYKLDVDIFNKFIKYHDNLKNIFEFNNFSSYNVSNGIQKSIFKEGIYEDIDILSSKNEKKMESYNLIIKTLSDKIDKRKNTIKLEYTDKKDWYIYLTKTRCNVLKRYLENNNINVRYNDKKYIFTKENLSFINKDNTNMILKNSIFDELSNDIVKLNNEISNLNKKYWNETINGLYINNKKTIKEINNFIADLDCSCNNAYISIKYNYYRPEICNNDDKSFVKCSGLRHPLAEEINKSVEYIKNDISLGMEGQNGILLYGMNSGGKSCLAKSIALSLVMAQAGIYVPSDNFTYKPYKKIFTRILSNDKLWSGQSSFQVEVNEMGYILKNADKNSFVIGDEVFNSTENVSAISLVNGCINKLHDLESSFIFASHLHELYELPDIQKLLTNNLKIYHLNVYVEENVLIFNRKLTAGPGINSYGIIVAEKLGMLDDIISIAQQTKLYLNNEKQLINNKKSNYNSNIIMDKCNFPGCDESSEETHHIIEQDNADENGNVGAFHKNKDHNCCPLCKKHHADITHGSLVINGWILTSNGRKLDYEYKTKKTKKKMNPEQLKIIIDYYNNNKLFLSKKDILNKLKVDKDIQLSITLFLKIIKDNY